MLDLAKAFDTADYTILCNEIEPVGIGFTDCFRSYWILIKELK